MQTRFLFVMLLCLSVSSLHTKLAGLAWLLLLVAAVSSLRRPALAPHQDISLALRHWLMGVTCFLATSAALALIWPEPGFEVSSDINTGFRLLAAAVATAVLVQRTDPLHTPMRHASTAAAVALALGFLLTLLVSRPLLPSHPIPWAVSMSIWVAFLLPQAMSNETPKHWVWAYGGAATLGIVAVLLSESRGAYAIAVWPLILLVANSLRHHRQAAVRAGWLGTLSVCLLAASVLMPQDPLRLRLAWNEVNSALKTQDFNTSLGARVYLFQTGWAGFMESPWIGIGATERINRLQSAGLDLPAADAERHSLVRTLGHVHNQYLHQAMDGGLLGLSGLLALLGGLVAAAWRLRKTHRIASQQLGGMAFVHGIAGLSNVNFAHNYYALMLGMGVTLALLQASIAPQKVNG